MSVALKQPVIIDNRPGASGTIGSEYVARAAPDGYTLMLNATTHAIVNALNEKLPFDADSDFTPISMVGRGSLVLVVHPDVPVHSVKDLVALAKASPGKIAFASTGSGSSPHLAGEMFMQAADVNLIHVPYKGSAPAISDLVGGQVQVMFEAMPSAAPHIKSGRLRAIAVSTAKRFPAMPELPTIAESGVPGFEVNVWWGIFAPAKLPRPLADRISAAVNATLSDPEIRARFATLGIEPAGTTSEEFRGVLQRDMKMYGKVIKDRGIRAE
jgi:tripartite-type tricarboxylate transporter receptor subunit TctC